MCQFLYLQTQRNAQFSILVFNFCCLLHVTNLVGSSAGRQLYTHRIGECVGVSLEHTPTHSPMNTLEHILLPTRLFTPMHVKGAKKLHIQLSLRMNPRGSKHVGDNRDLILIGKIVHFVGLCCVTISQCTVQKT